MNLTTIMPIILLIALLGIVKNISAQGVFQINLEDDTIYGGRKCGRWMNADSNYLFCLTDLNSNDQYFDTGVDGISVRNLTSGEFSTCLQDSNILLQIGNGSRYDIIIKNSNVYISPCKKYSLKVPNLSILDNLPLIQVQDLFLDTLIDIQNTVKKTTADYIILSFWSPKAPEEEFSYFKLFDKKISKKISYIHIFWDYEKDEARSLVTRITPPGIFGYCSREGMEKMNVYFLPYAFIYDYRGHLIKSLNGVNSIFNYLQKQ